MIELLIVIAVCAGLALLVLVGVAAPELVLVAGAVAIAAGMLVGLPASALYHFYLRRALASRGPLPRRWWLNPMPHHREVVKTERGAVLGWFYAGVVGFVLAVTGCALVLVSIVRAL